MTLLNEISETRYLQLAGTWAEAIRCGTLPPGSLRLRQQIVRRAMTLDMLLEPGDITLTHGCMDALQLALRVTTKPGDCIGLESPTYFYLLPLLASVGLKALEIPTDPQLGLSRDVLKLLLNERRLNAVIVMPTVQNPLGCTLPLAAKSGWRG